MSAKRNRPSSTTGTAPKVIAATVTSIPQVTGATYEARRRSTGYAVVVHNGDRWRRALYFSLHAASQAAERARSRGATPYLQLVELVPVDEVL